MLRKPLHLLRRSLPNAVGEKIYRVGLFLRQKQEVRFPDIRATLTYLKDWGFAPRTVVDVGAFHGEFTQLVKGYFPAAQVLMVEPQEAKKEILQAVCDSYGPSVKFESALLGPVDGQIAEFVEMETGSSVLEEQSPYPRTKVLKRLTTLDDLLQSTCQWDRIDFLKLDVQGFELDVLKGASENLKKCEMVLLEASLVATNKGCPLVADVLRFMNDHGFRLLDFCSQIRRKDGVLWQTDLMFINEASVFLPKAELTQSNW